MTEKEFRTRIMPLRRRMYGMALRLGVPPDDAADAMQETMMRLWRSRHTIPPGEGELESYCLRAFRNECINFFRRQRPEDDIEEMTGLAGPPGEGTEFRDTRRHIELLIDSLPEGQSEAIRLSSFGGFDNTEIAEATGRTEANVRQLLSRGRRRLRELIDKSFRF